MIKEKCKFISLERFFMKKRRIIISLIIVILFSAAGFFITAVIPAKFEKNDIRSEFPLKNETEYDRENVRRYAEYASEYLQNDTFRFLSPENGDSATDCANFVSQCLYAGGFKMTDEWYMKKYSETVPEIKRTTDKIALTLRRFISLSFDLCEGNDYTDTNYMWTYTWSCAGEQIDFFEDNFAEKTFEVNDFDKFSDIVKNENIKTGDIIYQSVGNIHHVVIVSKVSDDGTVYISSHNPPLFDCEINKDSWTKRGFSGGAVILKIKDKLT